MIETKNILISKLQNNEGQIEGVPKNPRFIKDSAFKNLVQSIKELPEMLDLRELIVYPLNENYIVLGGNMRLRAGVELKFTEMPCKILNKNTRVEVLRQIVMKDNGSYGKNDSELLANEWEDYIEDSWGLKENEGYFQQLTKDERKENEKFDEKLPYPITIVVEKKDYDLWQKIKNELSQDNDFQAFITIYKKYCDILK
jgi:hypothetical protein